MLKNLFIVDVFLKGGWVMVPILFCSILALAVIIERIRFFSRNQTPPEMFMKKVKSSLFARDYAEAMKVCRRENSPIAHVIAAGIDHLDLPRDGIQDVMRQEALRQLKRVEMRHWILSTISQVSPLLGLTGTVTGMITAFSVISTIGITDPTALAGGISEALYTTAAGLFVGIPTLAAHSWCEGKVHEFMEQVEYCSLDLVNFLPGVEAVCEKVAA